MRSIACASLLALSLGAGRAAGTDLSVLAELPLAGAPDRLVPVRLGRDGAAWLVSVNGTMIQAWRVGSTAGPVVTQVKGRNPAFADFDGDGLLDVALLRFEADQPPRIVLLRGDGAGRFAEARSFALDGQAYDLAAGDVDGDGRPDLVLGASALPDGNDVVLKTFRSLGGLLFGSAIVTHLPPTIFNIGSVVAGEVDGDGLADVVLSSSQGPVAVYRSRGDGTFALATGGLRAYRPGPAVLADLDHDGQPDLAYRSAPFSLEVQRNAGGGAFEQLAQELIGPISSDVVAADVNGDGALDLVIAQAGYLAPPGVFFSVFPGDGHGGFGPEERWPVPRPGTLVNTIATVDWGGDGRADLVLATATQLLVFGAVVPGPDRLEVPVVLSTNGLLGSRFDSDLLLTNSATTPARATLSYTAFAGGGTGDVVRDLAAGAQLYAPSALDFLRDAGLGISPGGPLLGTLRIATTRGVRASVRTMSPSGAGVSYRGVPGLEQLRFPALVPWLVESERDRTNLALVNAGDEPITLRVTVVSGDRLAPGSADLPDVALAPGGFFQFGRVLSAAGLSARLGWARITRVAGSAPYLAWGVVNDAGTGDGSFIPAVAWSALPASRWIVPSVVQSARYSTELVVTNPSEEARTVHVTLAATGATFDETLAPHAVFYLPDLFAELRRRALPGAPAADASVASPLYVDAVYPGGVAVGVRVSTSPAPGRFFGVFEPAVDLVQTFAGSMVVSDLRQDERTRTNLGVVNLADGETAFRLDVYDGATGALAATHPIRIPRGELLQINSVLQELAPSVRRGWARITPDAPTVFSCYGVVMDGAAPGVASDDGSLTLGARD